jgi:tetratricopeptide (TPR) repeat protein
MALTARGQALETAYQEAEWRNEYPQALRGCAHDDFDAAITIDPSYVHAYLQRGLLDYELMSAESRVSSAADFETALRLQPSAPAFVGRGLNLFPTDQAAAAEQFRRAIQLDPTYAPGHFHLGIFYELQVDYPAAMSSYNRAIQLAPSNPDYVATRAVFQLRAGGGEAAALADWAMALRLRPGHRSALHERIQFYRLRGQLDLALEDLNAAIRFDPRDFVKLGERAELLEQMGQIDRAIRDRDRVLELHEEWGRPDAIFNGAISACRIRMRHRRDLTTALALCGRAVAAYEQIPSAYVHILAPNGLPNALNSRGTVLLELGRFEESFVDYDRAALLDPSNAEYQNNRCWVRAVANLDLDVARTACDQSLQLRPNDANTLDSRGLVGLKQQRWQDAWNDYNAAIRFNTEVANYYFGRGIAALRLGRMAEGQADLVRATQLNASIAQIYANYGITP